MKQLLAKHNLKITRVLPMPLDAYYVSLLSEKYSGTNGQLSLYTKAIANGFRSNNRAKETKEYSSLIYVIGK